MARAFQFDVGPVVEQLPVAGRLGEGRLTELTVKGPEGTPGTNPSSVTSRKPWR
jgi:hypothetical protein